MDFIFFHSINRSPGSQCNKAFSSWFLHVFWWHEDSLEYLCAGIAHQHTVFTTGNRRGLNNTSRFQTKQQSFKLCFPCAWQYLNAILPVCHIHSALLVCADTPQLRLWKWRLVDLFQHEVRREDLDESAIVRHHNVSIAGHSHIHWREEVKLASTVFLQHLQKHKNHMKCTHSCCAHLVTIDPHSMHSKCNITYLLCPKASSDCIPLGDGIVYNWINENQRPTHPSQAQQLLSFNSNPGNLHLISIQDQFLICCINAHAYKHSHAMLSTLALGLSKQRRYDCTVVGFFFFWGGGGGGRSPAISLGFTTFGWDFCICDRFLIQPLR